MKLNGSQMKMYSVKRIFQKREITQESKFLSQEARKRDQIKSYVSRRGKVHKSMKLKTN